MRRVLLLLALGAFAAADDDSAQYFLGRAREALAANDLDGAAGFLTKAAKEKEGYPPTLYALADLAKRRGETKTAITCLEMCLAQRERADLSPAEKEAMVGADKMLAELDEARAQFKKLVAEHVKDVARLAGTTKDPELKKECWRLVLQLQPDHAEARAALEGKKEERPPLPGTPLFNGKDLDGWAEAGPAWTVEGGILRGHKVGANVNRTEAPIQGNFTLVCEMRVKQDVGDYPLFAVLFGIKGQYDHFGLFLWPESFRLERNFEEHRRSDLARHTYKRLSEKFNLSDWHTYRIKVEGKRVLCSVDDREIMESGAIDRELDGPVGFWLQDVSVEIRGLSVEQAK